MIATMLLAMFATGSQGADKQTTVRAFVFTETAASGQPDRRGTGAARRRARHARRAREEEGHHRSSTTARAPTCSIEVVGREQREEPTGSFGGKSVTRMGDTIIRLRLKSGDEESDLKGMGQGTWGRAAKDAADRIVKWIARREPARVT